MGSDRCSRLHGANWPIFRFFLAHKATRESHASSRVQANQSKKLRPGTGNKLSECYGESQIRICDRWQRLRDGWTDYLLAGDFDREPKNCSAAPIPNLAMRESKVLSLTPNRQGRYISVVL